MISIELFKILVTGWLATLFVGVVTVWLCQKMYLWSDSWWSLDRPSLKFTCASWIAIGMVLMSCSHVKYVINHYLHLLSDMQSFAFLCLYPVYFIMPVLWVSPIWNFFYKRNTAIRLKAWRERKEVRK